MHTANIGRRVGTRAGFRTGGCQCGCNLRQHCRVWSCVHFQLLGQPAALAAPGRRVFSLLPGCQDLAGKTCRKSLCKERRRSPDCVRIDVHSNAHKSDDDHFVRGDFCRPGVGGYPEELRVGRDPGAGRVHRFRLVVVPVERYGGHIPGKLQARPAAMGQPDFRRDHHWIRNICPCKRAMIKIRYKLHGWSVCRIENCKFPA